MRAVSVLRFGAEAVVTGGLGWLAVTLGPEPASRWAIVHRYSAHGALVIDVETRHLDEAVSIARAIGEPEQGRFTEILIYFHRPGHRDMLRRVQWTRLHGYIETVYP